MILVNNVIGAQHSFAIDGSGTPLLFKANSVSDTTFVSASPINAVMVTSWFDTDSTTDTITAPYFTTVRAVSEFDADLSAGGANARGLSINVLSAKSLVNSSITASGKVNVISAGSFNGGTITAGALQTGAFNGNFTGQITAGTIGVLNVHGAMNNSTITSTAPVGNAPGISLVSVGGAMTSTSVRATGNIRVVRVGSALASQILAGVSDSVQTLPSSSADFVANATITSFAVAGRGTFSETNVAASAIKAAVLGVVQTDANPEFGIAALDGGLKVLVLTQNGKHVAWTPKQPESALSFSGNFAAKLLSN